MFPRRLLASLACLALGAGCTTPATTTDAGPDAAADAAMDSAGDAADAVDDGGDAVTPQPSCSRVAGRPASHAFPRFERLSAPVEVVRDELGIPHLYARTDEDAMFASGYTQAVDRLFQMERMKRSAAGTLAELLGRRHLGQDQIVRMMDIPRWGRESTDRMQRERPDVFRLVVAWVAGVNRRVEEVRSGRAPLPLGFRQGDTDVMPSVWTPDDPIAIGRLILFQNANQLEYDILASVTRSYVPAAENLPMTQSLNDAFIVPPEERPAAGGSAGGSMLARPPLQLPADASERLARFAEQMRPFRSGGSNNWALAGRHTFNGRPLIAGDPHQSLQSPPVLWAQHLNSMDAGGGLDVIGFAFAGAPGVHLGHNRHVAWTATTAYPDVMDLFEVRASGATIRLGTETLPVERCVERIAVRGEAAVEYVVEDVPGKGVLLPRTFVPLPITTGSNRLLFRWTGFRATNDAEVFFGFDTARNTDEFDAAARRMEVGSFNFIAADARGIVYRSRVLVPDRGATAGMPAPNAVLDGANPRALWRDGAFLADDRQPHSRGGARGFVASANNDPFGFTSDGRIEGDAFYYGVWFDPGTRGRRIEAELARLTTAGMVTVRQMQELQNDTHNVLADELLPVLAEAMRQVDTNPALASFRGDARLASLASLLASWDRRMERDSAAAVVFEGWQHFFAREVLSDDLGPVFDPALDAEPVYVLKVLALVVNRRSPNADRALQTPREVSALRALAATRDWLAARFGGTEASRYRWDQFHRTRVYAPFSNPGRLDGTTLLSRGSVGTVNVSSANFFSGANPNMFHESSSGAVYRMVASFAADGTPVAEVNFVRGNSGDPDSPYWANAETDWVEARYRPLPFRRADVDAAARERTTIMP